MLYRLSMQCDAIYIRQHYANGFTYWHAQNLFPVAKPEIPIIYQRVQSSAVIHFCLKKQVCLPELRFHTVKNLEVPLAMWMFMTPTPATWDGSFGCASMKIHQTHNMLRHCILMYFVCYLPGNCKLSCQLCLKSRSGRYNYGKVDSRRQNDRKKVPSSQEVHRKNYILDDRKHA